MTKEHLFAILILKRTDVLKEVVSMRRRYRLKNKKRFACVLVLFTLITVFAGLMVTAGASSQGQVVHDYVVVSQGDTLWEIASTYGKGMDPRAYIYEIKMLNKLTSDNIYAGQQLYLPY